MGFVFNRIRKGFLRQRFHGCYYSLITGCISNTSNLKKSPRFSTFHFPQMAVGKISYFPAPGRSHQVTFLDKEGLIHLLNCPGILSDCS